MKQLNKINYHVIYLTIVFLLAAVCAVLLFAPSTDEPIYEAETVKDEIDFSSPEIKVHTAADGIAVIGGLETSNNSNSADHALVSPLDALVKLTGNPAEIWQAETTSTPTHSGFTMPVPMDDDSIGVLTISDIGLSVRVYESDDQMEDMTKGVSHFKSTSAWDGNIGLSAHNVNFDGSAGYFYSLHTLQKGVLIEYETALGKREYVVTGIKEISETDWSPLGRTDDNKLTLITCITGKPAMRLAVIAAEK